MEYERLIQSLSNQATPQAIPPPLVTILRQYLSVKEAVQILEQFQSDDWIPNGQVLWSGMLREQAQEWADRHRLQTLTTAMGPLMDVKHPDCLKLRKSNSQWSNYVHGASAIFAWRIAQGENVTLLSPPPPERFHPSGLSYYQLIEEPIIRGLLDKKAVQKIMIVHPMITKSNEFLYELWPNDKRDKWVERFGPCPYNRKWRQVGHRKDMTLLKSLVAFSEQQVYSAEKVKQCEKNEVSNSQSFTISNELSLIILSRLPSSILLMLFYYLWHS